MARGCRRMVMSKQPHAMGPGTTLRSIGQTCFYAHMQSQHAHPARELRSRPCSHALRAMTEKQGLPSAPARLGRRICVPRFAREAPS